MTVRLRKRYRKVHGVGVNDADYNVYTLESGKIVGKCRYYECWVGMLRRCYSEKLHLKYPSYIGCEVFKDWQYFMNFKSWVDSQPERQWRCLQLDKDLLGDGTLYSPENCAFIPKIVNTFISYPSKKERQFMLGVSLREFGYSARCNNPLDSNQSRYIGYFKTEYEAHRAWQSRKHSYSCILAEQQSDKRVAKALRERYSLNKDWTNV